MVNDAGDFVDGKRALDVAQETTCGLVLALFPMRNFLSDQKDECSFAGLHLAQQASHLMQVPSVLPPAAPFTSRSSILGGWHFGRLLAIIKKLVHGNLKRASQLLQSLNRWDCVPVFYAGDVAAQ